MPVALRTAVATVKGIIHHWLSQVAQEILGLGQLDLLTPAGTAAVSSLAATT